MDPEQIGKSGARREIRHGLARREVVAMGYIVLGRGTTEFFSRGNFADEFDLPCVFRTRIGHSVANGRAADILVTIILEFFEPGGTFVEGIDDPGIFVGVGEERGGGLGVHEEGSELGSGHLEADFRELLGVMFAEVIGEVVLEMSEAALVFLFGAPFLVTAAGAPVGDIAFGDGDAALFQSPDDLGIAGIIVEELVDQVAFGFRQARDFPVAGALAEPGGGRGRKGEYALVRIVSGRQVCGRLNGPALDEGAFLFDTVGAVAEEVSEGRGGASGLGDSLDVEDRGGS